MFIFRLKDRISFSKIKVNVGLDSLAERHRTSEQVFKLKLMNEAPRSLNFCRSAELYVSSIQTNAYYNSFWPRSTRELGDAVLSS